LNTSRPWYEHTARSLLLLFACSLPISISLAELFAYLAIFNWAFLMGARRDWSWMRSPLFWPAAAFAALALLSACWGLRPLETLDKSSRLLFLALIFAIGTVFNDVSGGEWHPGFPLVAAYVGGTALLGVIDLVRVPWEMLHGVALYDTGNMRDPQMYLVALCFLLGAWILRVFPRHRLQLAVLLWLATFGLLIHFKRGAWLAFALAALMMGLVSGRRRLVGVILAGAALILLLPQTRARLEDIRQEWSQKPGGRYVLWTRVAPVLLREYPHGIGYGASEHEDFKVYPGYIQPELNHLHNNLLQVALEMGRLGVCIWGVWMAMSAALMFRRYRQAAMNDDRSAWIGLGTLGAFAGLMFNGLVEYNFGDSEILMLVCLLFGVANAARPVSPTAEDAA